MNSSSVQSKKSSEGFVALITAMIISAMLLLISAVLSFSGFFARYNIMDSEFKEISLASAEACASAAYLQLAVDYPNRRGLFNATSTIGADQCFVSARDESTPGKVTFKARSMYKNYYTTLKVTIETNTLSIVSWEELTFF